MTCLHSLGMQRLLHYLVGSAIIRLSDLQQLLTTKGPRAFRFHFLLILHLQEIQAGHAIDCVFQGINMLRVFDKVLWVL